jgi:tetratricopeptide (TPR) repeat protein
LAEIKSNLMLGLPKCSQNRRALFRWLVLLFPLLLLVLPIANAQARTNLRQARLEGKVLSADGDSISGATVWLEQIVDATALEEKTGDDGKYSFSVAQGGSFRLKVSKDGFHDLAVDPLPLTDGQTKHLDLPLQKIGAEQSAAKSASPAATPAKPIELSDQPKYAVAGVTDWSNVGLHGSDTTVRTSEKLSKDAAAMKPPSPAPKTAASAAADTHRLAGDAKEKSADPVGALTEYERALKLDPSEENYFAWAAQLLLHRGGAAAVEAFQKGVTAYPKSARMFAGLGAALYADGQDSEAAERMCAASDLSPSQTAPYEFLGRMESASQDLFGCSESRLARFAHDQPSSATAHYYYGLVLWKEGRRVQSVDQIRLAEAHLRKAAALVPNYGEVYVQLGMMYNARGDRAAALAEFQKAVEVTPKLAAAHYNLSLAYRRVGESDKAEQEMSLYDDLHHKEEAERERERRELRQFVTILKDGASAEGSPH